MVFPSEDDPADGVPEQDREDEPDEPGDEADLRAVHRDVVLEEQVQHLGEGDDHVEQVAERDGEEREVDDEHPADGVGGGEADPDDARDDEPRHRGLEEQRHERDVEPSLGDVPRRVDGVAREDAAVRQHERADPAADEVAGEDDRPVAEERGEAREAFERERHRREGVLGVQLVAADDDVDEAERVQQHAQDGVRVRRRRQRRVQHERDGDRQPGGEPAEEQLAAPRGHLLVRGRDDPLEHLVGGEPVPDGLADRWRAAPGPFDDLPHRIVVGSRGIRHWRRPRRPDKKPLLFRARGRETPARGV